MKLTVEHNYSTIKVLEIVTGAGRVIEGVWGDKRAAVQWTGQHELDLADPLLDGFRLGLRLFGVCLEEVGEVSIQVVTTSIVPVNNEYLSNYNTIFNILDRYRDSIL